MCVICFSFKTGRGPECFDWYLFIHIIRTVNFRVGMCTTCWASFFMLPMRQLKCKRTSTYSHQRWCRGGKGLQSVGKFLTHHPSFPSSKAWICVLMCKKKKKVFCTPFLSLWDTWFSDPDTHSQHPPTGSVSAPLAGQLPHFLSRKGGSYSRRMYLFIKTGTAWIFQTGNVTPQCHPTRRRGLWASLWVKWAEVKSQIGTWLPGTTCSQWRAGWQTKPWKRCRDKGLVKPFLTMSAWISARPATGIHFAVENHQYESRHVLALLIICSVCGWRGWASLWTYQAFQVGNKA